jgi:hypothetical protein
MRWARLVPGSSSTYAMEPMDLLLWTEQARASPAADDRAEPAVASHWNPRSALHDLRDQDVLQATASLVLHRLAWQRKEHLDKHAFAKYAQQDEAVKKEGASYD